MNLAEDIKYAIFAMRLARLMEPHGSDDRVEEIATHLAGLPEEELMPIAKALRVELP